MRVGQQERINQIELDGCLNADLPCGEFCNVQSLTIVALSG